MLVKPTRRARLGLCVGAVAVLSSATSLAADPTKDECVDANEEAQDLRLAGALLQARARLAVCMAPQCPGPVRDDCVARLRALDEVTPTLVLEAADDGASGPYRVIEVDGHSIGPSAVTTPMPVDPGTHQVVFESDDGIARTVTMLVHEGEKDRRVVVPLPAPSRITETGLQRPAGLVIGGVGLGGLALGGLFAALAKSTDARALSNECGGNPSACSASGAQAGDRAHAEARVATIAFIGGAVLLGAGAWFYFTAPGGHRLSLGATGGGGHASLSLGGNL